ncbi:MAG: peptidylprolyl isomerase [Alphaproteobacteria bacterium]
MADQVSASHILLMYEGSANSTASRSKEEAAVEIERLRQEIEGGADFAELAREHSDCPSGGDGGALGMFGRGQMVPEFETASFALEIGATSATVETDFGFHLIQRTG